jgi:hypothetical protein
MPVALTMTFIEAQGGRSPGWSETVVLPNTTVADTSANTANCYAYMKTRCFMLGTGVVNNYAKLTLLAAGRPSIHPVRRLENLLVPFVPVVGTVAGLPYYNFLTKLLPADFSQQVYLIRFYTDPTVFPQFFRSFWIAGIPDAITDIESPIPLAGAWWTAYGAWKAFVLGIAPNAGILIAGNDRSAGNPPFTCTIYDGATGKLTLPGNDLLTGQQVEAIGWRAFAGGTVPRGNYKVTVNSDGTVNLQGAQLFKSIKTLGAIRPVSWVYTPVVDYETRGWTNKKKGRPFGQLRGRRSVSRTARA